IIRNVNIAAGYGTRGITADGIPDSYVYDAMNIHANNVMVDHVSTVFGTDETISADEFANHTTVQYSNISQAQNYPQWDAEGGGYKGHALGSLWQPGSNATTSILHNLYAHDAGRLPRVGTEASKLTVTGVGSYNDFRNNVIYNWIGTGGSGASAQPGQTNFINNFWLAGPGGEVPTGTTDANGIPTLTTSAAGTGIFAGSDATNTKVFHSGNLKDINKDGDALDGLALANGDFGASNFQGSAFSQVPYYGLTET